MKQDIVCEATHFGPEETYCIGGPFRSRENAVKAAAEWVREENERYMKWNAKDEDYKFTLWEPSDGKSCAWVNGNLYQIIIEEIEVGP